ncbi:signal peptidase II [Desulfopila aestuarii]|uniref:Signal peptidase II n=1 Tax=Desulfopila aestuarii DSM 18488 TaxID=1121416 RepID=A0A1M7Y399_9BACT|nr:signal peptidase II [Desulfopila aestuarii]SHO46578.1 signal peptidase II [Desulfopila aestuarii DSM 18488]
MIRRLRLFCIILFLGTAADQLTKALAHYYLAGNDPILTLWGCLEFRYIENFSGFLGYLSFLPNSVRLPLLTIGVAIVLIIFACILIRQQKIALAQSVAGFFVLAGGVGNLIDRLHNSGGVIDFMVIGIGTFRTGVFNLGDLYILAGSFYLGCSLANLHNPLARPSSRC